MICYETTTLERKKRQLNYSITAFVGMTDSNQRPHAPRRTLTGLSYIPNRFGSAKVINFVKLCT